MQPSYGWLKVKASILRWESMVVVVLEAWMKLKRENPQVARRSMNMLKNVLNPTQCKASDMLSGIEHWEQLCRRYTDRKGPGDKKRELPDDIRMGILQEMCPPELRMHLYLNSQTYTSSALMRREVIGFLQAKMDARPYKDAFLDVGSTGTGTRQRKRKRQGQQANPRSKARRSRSMTSP